MLPLASDYYQDTLSLEFNSKLPQNKTVSWAKLPHHISAHTALEFQNAPFPAFLKKGLETVISTSHSNDAYLISLLRYALNMDGSSYLSDGDDSWICVYSCGFSLEFWFSLFLPAAVDHHLDTCSHQGSGSEHRSEPQPSSLYASFPSLFPTHPSQWSRAII